MQGSERGIRDQMAAVRDQMAAVRDQRDGICDQERGVMDQGTHGWDQGLHGMGLELAVLEGSTMKIVTLESGIRNYQHPETLNSKEN